MVAPNVTQKMDLDEVFSNKDSIADAVGEKLTDQMEEFGFQILQALVINVEPDRKVQQSMNAMETASFSFAEFAFFCPRSDLFLSVIKVLFFLFVGGSPLPSFFSFCSQCFCHACSPGAAMHRTLTPPRRRRVPRAVPPLCA